MIAEAATFWFILFAGQRGTPIDDMKPMTAAGPLPIEQCYAIAALGIDALNAKNPKKDFAGVCWPTVPTTMKDGKWVIERDPKMKLLNLQQLDDAFHAATSQQR
jgi:hypothetical protein